MWRDFEESESEGGGGDKEPKKIIFEYLLTQRFIKSLWAVKSF